MLRIRSDYSSPTAGVTGLNRARRQSGRTPDWAHEVRPEGEGQDAPRQVARKAEERSNDEPTQPPSNPVGRAIFTKKGQSHGSDPVTGSSGDSLLT
jgi:hypothetical protein